MSVAENTLSFFLPWVFEQSINDVGNSVNEVAKEKFELSFLQYQYDYKTFEMCNDVFRIRDGSGNTFFRVGFERREID